MAHFVLWFIGSVLNALVTGPNPVNPNTMDLPGGPLPGAQSQNQPPAAPQPTGGPMPPPAWTPQQNTVQPPQSQPNMPPQTDLRSNMPGAGGPVPPGGVGPAPPGGVGPGSASSHQMSSSGGRSSVNSADMKKVYDALGLPYSQEGPGGGPPQLNQIPSGLGQTPGMDLRVCICSANL